MNEDTVSWIITVYMWACSTFAKTNFLMIIWLMAAESRAHNIIYETYEHCKHRNGDD